MNVRIKNHKGTKGRDDEMKKSLRTLIFSILLLPTIAFAQEQDWASVIEDGKVIGTQIFKYNACSGGDATCYGVEAIFTVLYQGKMWMCWQTYEEVVSEKHDFWCKESNKAK